jgi:hypothetical protein
MLSNPLDLRVYLTDRAFEQRVLRSHAWAEYLALPPISPFDEAAALIEAERRNQVRAEAKLPLIDKVREVARLKQDYEERTVSDRFHALAMNVIEEIYGSLRITDFNSLSALQWFMAGKRNLIRHVIEATG